MLKDQGIDVAIYLKRVESEGVGIVVSDVIRDSQKRDVHLPPGYWQALFDLRDEVIAPLSNS
jgi:dTDP-4-dehydrorhamnose 3,5-epimerase-like enzyme